MVAVPHDTNTLSIIIPTKNRREALAELIESIRQSVGLEPLQPEIIVGDNESSDGTWPMLEREAGAFPTPFRIIKVRRPGKSAVLNEAIGIASGEILAFVDDDVVVERGWLEAVHRYFSRRRYSVAQGVVRLPQRESKDPEIVRLLERFRTISANERPPGVQTVGSLNGANMAMDRSVFDQVGGFDERLGPGVSGTSEDTELGERILRARMKIGYMEEAVVFHRVERERLTEAYFRLHHRLQGRSRLIYKQPGFARICAGLAQGLMEFGMCSVLGKERRKYRGKGRVYHYGAMLAVKLRRMLGTTESSGY
jgi:GT2 family glycosyltransferase